METSNFKNLDLFAQPSDNPRLLLELPENCSSLPSSTRPFQLNKFILRKLETRRDMYFMTTNFWKNKTTEAVYCQGRVLRKKTQRSSSNQLIFAKLHDHLYELENTPGFENRYIPLTELHFSNDFYFLASEETDDENEEQKMYLLEWIL